MLSYSFEDIASTIDDSTILGEAKKKFNHSLTRHLKQKCLKMSQGHLTHTVVKKRDLENKTNIL